MVRIEQSGDIVDMDIYVTKDQYGTDIEQGLEYIYLYDKNLIPFLRALLPEGYEIREKEAPDE